MHGFHWKTIRRFQTNKNKIFNLCNRNLPIGTYWPIEDETKKDFVTRIKAKVSCRKTLRLKLSELLQDSSWEVKSLHVQLFCSIGWSWRDHWHWHRNHVQVQTQCTILAEKVQKLKCLHKSKSLIWYPFEDFSQRKERKFYNWLSG